jgi:hypothetical protein
VRDREGGGGERRKDGKKEREKEKRIKEWGQKEAADSLISL